MAQRLFVISDLHLGGDTTNFQMCSLAGQDRLAEFFRWTAMQHSRDCPVHVVLNGDIVDFLAEKDASGFAAFSDEESARDKLQRMLEEPKIHACFTAMQQMVQCGATLTLLLGNHDLELCLPAVRRELHSLLGHDRVHFLMDNQALTIGPVLIEHGNRYDPWNSVDHDGLRAVRSARSRNEKAPQFRPPPGSELVVRVMNDIKRTHNFIDLLKPENQAMLPILAVLASPEQLRKLHILGKAARSYLEVQFRRLCGVIMAGRANGNMAAIDGIVDYDYLISKLDDRIDEHGIPYSQLVEDTSPRMQASVVQDAMVETERLLDGLNEMAGVTGDMSAWNSMLGGGHVARTFLDSDLDNKIDRLRAALCHFYSLKDLSVNCENDRYLTPATASIRNGFQIVIYGHTHLLKKVEIDSHKGGLYLNTGTWADLILVPPTVVGNDANAGRDELLRLARELGLIPGVQSSPNRRQLPSFAQVDFADDGRCEADLWLFGGPQLSRYPVEHTDLWDLAEQFEMVAKAGQK